MFREMRRFKQELPKFEVEKILSECTSGVLAVLGDGGYPYAVPLSYVFKGDCIYFHCAKDGHKIDAVKSCDKASFCVTDKDEIVPEKYTTFYRSVIAFGKISVVENEKEKLDALRILTQKYRPGFLDEQEKEIDKSFNNLLVLKLRIEHVTGKAAKELL